MKTNNLLFVCLAVFMSSLAQVQISVGHSEISVEEENEAHSIHQLLRIGDEVMRLKNIIPPSPTRSVKLRKIPEVVKLTDSIVHMKTEIVPILRGRELFTKDPPLALSLFADDSNKKIAIGYLFLVQSPMNAYQVALGESVKSATLSLAQVARMVDVSFDGEVMIVTRMTQHRARKTGFTSQTTAVYRNLICMIDTTTNGTEIALAVIKACCPEYDARQHIEAKDCKTP